MVVNLRWVGRGAFTVGLLWHLWPSGTFTVTDKFFWFFVDLIVQYSFIKILSFSVCLHHHKVCRGLDFPFLLIFRWVSSKMDIFGGSHCIFLFFKFSCCILRLSSSVGIFGGGLCFEDLKRWQAWSHRFDHQNNKFQIAGCFRFLV